ncbi:MAG TPA: CoB--CoM heterodisulfide reductase iron-sulfur subunit A family protein [Ignavibacteriaceae bacterium]|nr:CoB--CoM heterodisulfide reductase iron-sulfur subunit A family protein [Ignavibacteriaceae bacterium]
MSENLITGDLLIVGAGIAGITAAVEAADIGINVILIEKNEYIGGKVAQFNKYFPKLCPPSCGLEINLKRMRNNPLIKIYTLAELTNVIKENDKYLVNIKLKPRYVNNRCTACGDCVKVCPRLRKNKFNYNMDETTAIYIPYENAYPLKYIIDKENCSGVSCNECLDACKFNAIDLNDKEKIISVETNSIIWAAGWEPYNAKNLDLLGYGKYDDVITNVMMERLSAVDGPTKGQILRLSDGEKVNSVAFVQCAGSRDENHLAYCSSVCCMASLKQTQYIREQNPGAEIHIHYIDVRTEGLLEDFYSGIQKDKNIHFHRGKIAKVTKDKSTNKIVVEAEDSLTGRKIYNSVDLVVLAAGMKPASENLPLDKSLRDEDGFLKSNGDGFAGCGVITRPKDVASTVREATGSILTVIQKIRRN